MYGIMQTWILAIARALLIEFNPFQSMAKVLYPLSLITVGLLLTPLYLRTNGLRYQLTRHRPTPPPLRAYPQAGSLNGGGWLLERQLVLTTVRESIEEKGLDHFSSGFQTPK